jgi:hypothetical protein
VGHREGDFDFRYRLFHLFPCANNIPICDLFFDPVVSSSVGLQSIREHEMDLLIRIDFESYDELCVETVARNVKQFQPGNDVFRNIAGAA